MLKLTFLQAHKDRIQGTGIIISYDKVMGEIEAMPEEMQLIMANPVIVDFFQEIGATHWQLTEVANGKVELKDVPKDSYNPILYRGEW